MKNKKLLMILLATSAGWGHPSLAQRQAVTTNSPLSANGILNGADLTGNVTLTVGTAGGPQTDILTSNDPFVAGPVAVSTAASSQRNIVFNSSSTVYGDIGVTQPGGPFLLNISGGNAGATVNFLGNVYATTLNVTGTGTVNFDNGATVARFRQPGFDRRQYIRDFQPGWCEAGATTMA